MQPHRKQPEPHGSDEDCGAVELATAAKQAFAGHAKIQQYSGMLLRLLA